MCSQTQWNCVIGGNVKSRQVHLTFAFLRLISPIRVEKRLISTILHPISQHFHISERLQFSQFCFIFRTDNGKKLVKSSCEFLHCVLPRTFGLLFRVRVHGGQCVRLWSPKMDGYALNPSLETSADHWELLSTDNAINHANCQNFPPHQERNFSI